MSRKKVFSGLHDFGGERIEGRCKPPEGSAGVLSVDDLFPDLARLPVGGLAVGSRGG